jgi:hypothetical protein
MSTRLNIKSIDQPSPGTSIQDSAGLKKISDGGKPLLISADDKVINAGAFEFLLKGFLCGVSVTAVSDDGASGFCFNGTDVAGGRKSVFERVTELQHNAFVPLADLSDGSCGVRVMQITEDNEQGAIEQRWREACELLGESRFFVEARAPQLQQPLEDGVTGE